MQQETGGRNVVGADHHGRGLMQIDDRFHGAWVSQHQDGMDPASNIDYGCLILGNNIDAFSGDVRNGVAAYNAGQRGVQNGLRDSGNPDQYTTGGHYSDNVLAMADRFRPLLTGGDGDQSISATTYTVVSGDTLGVIAARFNLSVSAIADANGISNPNLIYVDQVLRIPSSQSVQGGGDGSSTTATGTIFVVGPGLTPLCRRTVPLRPATRSTSLAADRNLSGRML